MNVSDKANAGDTSLGCMLLITGIPVVVMVRSFVVYQLCGYFVVPLGVPQLGMAHLYGLCIVVATIIPSPKDPPNDDRSAAEKAFISIGSSISVSLCLWGMGYICYLIM